MLQHIFIRTQSSVDNIEDHYDRDWFHQTNHNQHYLHENPADPYYVFWNYASLRPPSVETNVSEQAKAGEPVSQTTYVPSDGA